MVKTSRMIISLLTFFLLGFGMDSFSTPKGQTTNVTFDKALPEDISNENFPDQVDSFDFPDASLLDLVKAIGKLTNINFIIASGLESKKISIIAPSSITVAEAYKAFLSALAAHNYTIVKSGAFWKIVETPKALKDNTEVYGGDYFPNTDQLITRIIKLKYINAKDFEKSIRWLLSQDNKISTHESSNSIILSDYGSVIERIMKIVYEMDVPGSEEGIEIIQIEHASAEPLAEILASLLSVKGSRSRSSISRSPRKTNINLLPSSRSSQGNVKISNIIPDSRTNSLVVSANKEGVKRVRELVKKLDTPVDASRSGGVYVYHVLYGTAEKVYNTLMGIQSSSGNPARSSNRFFSNTTSRTRSNYSSRSPYSSRSASSPLFQNVTIMADENTNSLIISAQNKYDYERVLAVLRKIDIPRDQVFIQAIIVEMIVDQGDNKEINLATAVGSLFQDYFKREPGADVGWKDLFGSSVAGFLNRSFDINTLRSASFGPGLVLGLPFLKFLNQALGDQSQSPILGSSFDASSLNDLNLTADQKERILTTAAGNTANSTLNRALGTSFIPLLRLLKTSANVNVLSTPQLTTLDNVNAFIEVGENAPVGLTSTATVGALAQNSVDREDITLKLEITPHINPESGTVQMEINQKFDDFSSRSSSASELASKGVHILKRNIKTEMVLHDGETAVLGGLLTDKEIKTENKVPLLGDIPVVGWLFKGSEVQKEKRNLLVFITPTIIKGKEQRAKMQEILGEKLDERIHFIRKNMKGRDPVGGTLSRLIPDSKEALKKTDQKKRTWFWQKEESSKKDLNLDTSPEKAPYSDEELEKPLSPSPVEKLSPEDYESALPAQSPSELPFTDEEGGETEEAPAEESSEMDENLETEGESEEETGESLDRDNFEDGEDSESSEDPSPLSPEDLNF